MDINSPVTVVKYTAQSRVFSQGHCRDSRKTSSLDRRILHRQVLVEMHSGVYPPLSSCVGDVLYCTTLASAVPNFLSVPLLLLFPPVKSVLNCMDNLSATFLLHKHKCHRYETSCNGYPQVGPQVGPQGVAGLSDSYRPTPGTSVNIGRTSSKPFAL